MKSNHEESNTINKQSKYVKICQHAIKTNQHAIKRNQTQSNAIKSIQQAVSKLSSSKLQAVDKQSKAVNGQ